MGLVFIFFFIVCNLIGILLYLERGINWSVFIGFFEGKIYELFFLDGFLVLEVDFVFVISVIVIDVDEIFSCIKEIIKYIVNKYGIDKIYYGLLVFGNVFSCVRDFRWDVFIWEEVIWFLDFVLRSLIGDMLKMIFCYEDLLIWWILDILNVLVFWVISILNFWYFEFFGILNFGILNFLGFWFFSIFDF